MKLFSKKTVLLVKLSCAKQALNIFTHLVIFGAKYNICWKIEEKE